MNVTMNAMQPTIVSEHHYQHSSTVRRSRFTLPGSGARLPSQQRSLHLPRHTEGTPHILPTACLAAYSHLAV